MFVCEACRGSIDTSDPDVVYAVKLREAVRFVGMDVIEGAGVFFHVPCFPYESTSYRVKRRPERLSEAA